MIRDEFIIWAIKPGGGWISKAGNLTSDWREAKVYPLKQALRICALRTIGFGTAVGAFPVDLSHVKGLSA